MSRRGIHLHDLVVDLDETVWDWCLPLLAQPVLRAAHIEWVYPRAPLLSLLVGLTGGPLNAWTAGYGYRVDRVCEGHAVLAALLDLRTERGDRAEALPNVVTRVDFLRAIQRDPTIVPGPPPSGERWLSQKIPGVPALAGKPRVDAARILLDDRETNCRRFVAGGDGRSALWLRNTPRIWKDNLPVRRPTVPRPLQWADGVADALEEIADGRTSLYPIDPRPSDHDRAAVRIALPHGRVWREWIAPTRRIGRLLAP